MIPQTPGAPPRSPAALHGIRSDHEAFLRERERRMAMYGAALAWWCVHVLGEGLRDRDEVGAA